MNKKRIIAATFIFTLFSSFFTFAVEDEKLGFLNTSWSGVIPGTVITEPAITSYGFCLATDGKMLSAFSNEGVLLWEKPTRSSRNISITTLPEDFILLWDKRHKELKLLNPSGGEIWSKKLKYSLDKKPFSGRDGRIVIAGDNTIECYGMNGIRKWSLKTDKQKNLELQELPDGSVILFLSEDDGKTRALRISPFGKILEEITFSGEIKNAFTTKDGVFLIFTDGSAGMFSVTNDLSKNKWVIEKKSPHSDLVVGNQSYLYLELYNDKVVVNKINSGNGTILSSFVIDNINGLDLKLKKLTGGGLFIADSTHCYLYSDSGVKKWSAIMPENEGKNSWNYVLYTNDNHLIFCLDNWSVNAYRTAQGLGHNNKSVKQNYNSYYKIDTSPYYYFYSDTLSRDITGNKRLDVLRKGDYGADEQIFTSDLFSLCTAYLNKTGSQLGVGKKMPSVFDKDAVGVEGAFSQLGFYGTSDASSYIAKMIHQTTNSLYLQVLFNSVGVCGYDPQGKILKELENLIPKINYKDMKSLESACNAVYSICRFMGRPAFNRMGKDILKELMYPKYDLRTREYARDMLSKIIELDL